MIPEESRCYWEGTKRSFTAHWFIPPIGSGAPLRIELKNRWALLEIREGAVEFSCGRTRLPIPPLHAVAISAGEFTLELDYPGDKGWHLRVLIFDRFPLPELMDRNLPYLSWVSWNRHLSPGIHNLGLIPDYHLKDGRANDARPRQLLGGYMYMLKWSFFEWLGAGPCREFIDPSIPDKYMNPSFHEESPLTPRSAPRRWRWALLTRRCHELIVGRLREKQELDPEQVYKP